MKRSVILIIAVSMMMSYSGGVFAQEEKVLAVPFTPQAPYGFWGKPYGDACEEASLLNAHYFYLAKAFTKKIAQSEILKMVAFEKKKFGFYKDTNAEQTALIAREFLKYSGARAKYDVTLDDIKAEIDKGNPVVVPLAGRMLKNPYFTQPGPLYHMVTVRGYKNGTIITNDVGTRRGNAYAYDEDVFYEAMHDFNDGDIYNGKKAMIVLK